MREFLNGFIDLHTHTNHSDGVYFPKELIMAAKEKGIRILAITDHNRILQEEEFEELKQFALPEIFLVKGTEASCMYQVGEKKKELHCVCLFPKETGDLTEFKTLIHRNVQGNRRTYIEAMLDKLREADIDLGTFEEVSARFPTGYVGRPQIAAEMVRQGYAPSVEWAMDEYIGTMGKKRAYVENPNRKNFCDLFELIEAVKKHQGLIILAHLNYYSLTEEEERILLTDFSSKTGLMGGMETEYSKYDRTIRDRLFSYSQEYGLFASSASDYHGVYSDDKLDNQFPADIYEEMIRRWKEYYGAMPGNTKSYDFL